MRAPMGATMAPPRAEARSVQAQMGCRFTADAPGGPPGGPETEVSTKLTMAA
jgi:hypothetical protein